jgi:hypothetical protein
MSPGSPQQKSPFPGHAARLVGADARFLKEL